MKHRSIIAIFVFIQLLFILLLRAEFLTDWDSYLYTFGALDFQPVGLAGGRWFFTGLLGTVWRGVTLFHTVSPDSAWLVFSITVICFGLLNAGLFFTLAGRLAGKEAGILATAIFVSSPLTGLYGSAVMTETPAMTLLLAGCLLLTSRSIGIWRCLVAGVLFALAAAIREPLILMILLPAGLVWYREKTEGMFSRGVHLTVFLLAVGVVLAGQFLLTYGYAENWAAISKSWSLGMTRERYQMVGWLPKTVVVNFFCLVCWLGIFTPVILITIPEQLRAFRTFRQPWMVPLFSAVILYSIGQIANHSLVFNPRFAIFPGALLCIPAALGLRQKMPEKLKNPWLIGVILIVVHLSAISCFQSVFQGYYFGKSLAAKETYESLQYAPEGALFVPGRLTPAVELYKKLHSRDWRIIYAGWDFSDKELVQEVEVSRVAPRKVYVVEPEYWAEKQFRSGQYTAIENVWNRFPHRPSVVAHFSELILPPARTPNDLLRQFLNFLFS